MIDQFFKSRSERYTRGVIARLVAWQVHPDTLSWLGFAISATSAYFTIQQKPLLALLCWWSGRLFDGLDGQLARACGQQSKRGGFLDINLDMLVYSLVAVSFLQLTEWYLTWACILVGYVMCITSALSLGEVEPQRDNRTVKLAAGLAEAGETGLFYSLMWLWPAYGKLWCGVWLAVLSLTVLARFLRAYQKE